MAHCTRREFSKLALLALPSATLLSTIRALDATELPAHDGPWAAGVQIGLNVPYSFGSNTMNADDVLKNCGALGVAAVELRSQPVEAYLGAPPPAAPTPRGADSTARAAAAVLARGSAGQLRQ